MLRRPFRCALLAATAAAAACVGDAPADPDPDGNANAPDAAGGGVDAVADAAAADAGAPGPALGGFRITFYWITTEEEFSGPDDTSIYDPECAVLAEVPAAFADSLRIEGTGRLEDGRVVNYDGACPCPTTPCYHEVDAEHPWGSGAGNRPLVPFRSVAVDPDVVPIGTSLWVEELDGLAMPGDPPWGGFIHDGCVLAADTGGSIDGMHIDFFAVLRDYYLELDGALGLDEVTVYEGGARCP
jgi:3D (Asp-Asp-Asp) domain-containing protein